MDAIPHRRFIKSHIPLDGLPYNENVKYIQVTREMHDAFFSLQNHWNILTDQNLVNKDKYGDKPFPRFEDGGDAFMDKVDGIWKDILTTEEDHAIYEARASQLDPELREWIEKGSLTLGHYPDGK